MSNPFSKLQGYWQMHPPAIESLLARINATKLSDIPRSEPKPGDKPYKVENGVAHIRIVGCITDSPTFWDEFFGMCAAESVIDAMVRADRDPAVQSIEFYIDSPGGLATAGGMLAQAISALKKPTEARCGGLVASSAYRAACMTDGIIANRDSQIGCIGTYTVLTDTTKMQDEIGISLVLVSSGGLKGAGADGKITPELADDVQREITEINDLFVSDVAKGRGLTQTRARELADGRVHIASSAKLLGLVDSVESIIKENKNMNSQQFKAFATENPEDVEVKNLVAKGNQIGKAEGTAEGAQQERQRVLALFSAFPGRTDFIKAQIEKGADAQAAKADYADVLIEENKALQAKLETPAKLVASVQQQGQGAIPLAPATVPANQVAKPDGSDPKVLAEWEWDNQKPTGFSTKERYVAIRKAELTGQFRASK